jgi:hypothetical protein
MDDEGKPCSFLFVLYACVGKLWQTLGRVIIFIITFLLLLADVLYYYSYLPFGSILRAIIFFW